LRHVERTKVLLHLIDAYDDDVARAYRTIRQELAAYSESLSERTEIVALTKIEGLDAELVDMQLDTLRAVLPKGASLFAVSARAHTNLKDVLRALRSAVDAVMTADAEAEEDEYDESVPVIRLSAEQLDTAWQVESREDGFVISGSKIEKFARRTDMSNVHSVNRLRDIMKKTGITHELMRRGAHGDSMITIGDQSFTLDEQ
jgi:GTP-binding protein